MTVHNLMEWSQKFNTVKFNGVITKIQYCKTMFMVTAINVHVFTNYSILSSINVLRFRKSVCWFVTMATHWLQWKPTPSFHPRPWHLIDTLSPKISKNLILMPLLVCYHGNMSVSMGTDSPGSCWQSSRLFPAQIQPRKVISWPIKRFFHSHFWYFGIQQLLMTIPKN